jgi:hypothetical protein
MMVWLVNMSAVTSVPSGISTVVTTVGSWTAAVGLAVTPSVRGPLPPSRITTNTKAARNTPPSRTSRLVRRTD